MNVKTWRHDKCTICAVFDNIGKALAILRQERGLSQEQLAYRCKIGRPQVSKYEGGKELMKLDTLEKILKALNVAPDQFFRLMTSLDASLNSPLDGRGEAESRLLDDAFENLHSAIGSLQDAVERALPPRALRVGPAPLPGAPASQKDERASSG